MELVSELAVQTRRARGRCVEVSSLSCICEYNRTAFSALLNILVHNA